MYFQFRGLPSAIHFTAVSSRRCRVASCFASVTHAMYSFRLVGLNASKVASAFGLRRRAAMKHAGTVILFGGQVRHRLRLRGHHAGPAHPLSLVAYGAAAVSTQAPRTQPGTGTGGTAQSDTMRCVRL